MLPFPISFSNNNSYVITGNDGSDSNVSTGYALKLVPHESGRGHVILNANATVIVDWVAIGT